MHLWPFSVPPGELTVSAETRELLSHALIFKPPFVSAWCSSLRPTGAATGARCPSAGWLMVRNLPGPFRKNNVELLTLQTKILFLGTVAVFRTSITNMDSGNRFIQQLASSSDCDGVVAHSIVAVEGDGPVKEGGDGVVKYVSAHIDGVESERSFVRSHTRFRKPRDDPEVNAF